MGTKAEMRLYQINGSQKVVGIPLSVEEELYLMVYHLGKPWSGGWWLELCRSIADNMRQVGGDQQFLVFFPLLQDLLVRCRIEYDAKGWFVLAEIAREDLHEYWRKRASDEICRCPRTGGSR
ncbi:MAG: hypothetical protein FPO08_05720 [Geobacter sp.]|nr:MAG: hypothetical protein FPO08_05720 [Geobacter sp.]